MAKYKVVATGQIVLEDSIFSNRRWLTTADKQHQIISVAGMPWKDIPLVNHPYTGFGRSSDDSAPYALAVRAELTIDNFDVEIVNG